MVGTIDVVNNQWHHVAVTNHVGTRRIYLDGNFEGSTSGTGHMLNTDTVIGDLGDGLSNGAELNGYLHDLRITQGLVRYPYIAKPKILTTTNSNMEKPGGSFPTVSNASNTLFLIGHTNSIFKQFWFSRLPGHMVVLILTVMIFEIWISSLTVIVIFSLTSE